MEQILKQQEELLKFGEELLKESSKKMREAAGPDAWKQAYEMWMVRDVTGKCGGGRPASSHALSFSMPIRPSSPSDPLSFQSRAS